MENTDTSKKDKYESNYVDQSGNVYILGGFDESINDKVIPYLKDVIEVKSSQINPSITIYINSDGGYCHILYNLLCVLTMARNRGIKIITINMGRAYSCGSLLFCFGDERKMYEYSSFLMHFGSTYHNADTPKQSQRVNKHINEHFNNIVEIYARHSKLKKNKIIEFMEDDCCYLNALDCIKYGLADEIISEINMDEDNIEEK